MTKVPNTALVLERDLFFVVKIRETLTSAGYTVSVAKTADDLRARLAADTPLPAIVLVHFGVPQVEWQAAIAATVAMGVPVLAYGQHVDIAGQQAARAAGATRVIANSKLSADLPGQVERTIARQPTPQEEAADD